MNSVIFNYQAANAARQYNIVSNNNRKTTEKLSSGYKINRAADDAAGLSISEKMRWNARGLHRASSNILDGVSLVQTAEGAMNEVDAILQRMRELSVQAANDTNTDLDRSAIQAEIDESIKEIDHIAETTSFNGIYPLRAEERFLLNDTGESVVEKVETPTTKGNGDYKMNGIVTTEKGSQTLGVNCDFSNVSNPNDLDGKTFYATCSQACNQVFTFSFTKDKNLSDTEAKFYMHESSPGSKPTVKSLHVDVGIGDIADGKGIPAAIGEALKKVGATSSEGKNTYQIGHANLLYIDGSNMAFYSTYKYPPTPDNIKSWSSASESRYSLYNVDGSKLNDGKEYRTVYMNGLESIIEVKSQEVKIPPDNPQWGLKIQSGSLAWQEINVPLVWMEAKTMGHPGIDPLDVMSFESAGHSIDALDSALDWANRVRSTFGAVQNRLEEAMKVDDTTAENTESSESRIRDTDIASEMVKYSMENILKQAGEAMLAQANQNASQILSLIS